MEAIKCGKLKCFILTTISLLVMSCSINRVNVDNCSLENGQLVADSYLKKKGYDLRSLTVANVTKNKVFLFIYL